MGQEINIYCDESRHLEKDKTNFMAIGAITCPKAVSGILFKRIRELKREHGLPTNFEIKWSKVSPSKLKFYSALIDMFFKESDLAFRTVAINKTKLDHLKHGQTHDQFIYKMHFETIKVLLDPRNVYFIYIDMKDSQGGRKIKKLHDVICSVQYDFKKEIIRNVVQVQAEQVELVQLCDLLIGAVCYINNDFKTSKAKLDLIKQIQQRSGYSLTQTTLVKENKFNILVFPR